MKIRKYIIVPALLVLSSCYSFNKIDLKEYEKGQLDRVYEAITPEQRYLASLAEETSRKKKAELACQPFTLPAISPMPDLPFDSLLKVNPNDSKAIDKLQVAHIEELRNYITRLKQQMITAQLKHNQTCKIVIILTDDIQTK